MKLILAAACLLLAACAAPVTRHERIEYECHGRRVATDVIVITSDSSPLDCIQWAYHRSGIFGAVFMALQLPLACMAEEDNIAWIYVPSWAPWLVDHEIEHVRGAWHPPGVPFNVWDDCAT